MPKPPFDRPASPDPARRGAGGPRRTASDPFHGVLLVDKPAGPTSHDVVDAVRRGFGIRKVGHCGTLDPLATGLLILVLGKATRLAQYLIGDDKEYRGHLVLGISTDSQDAQGEIVDRRPIDSVTEERVAEVFARFQGDILQTPPMVSAIKKGGKPLYKLARKGKSVEREPRLVHIYELLLEGFDPPRVAFSVRCSKGTYVRTLCADIGESLGCGAHLGGLRRIRSGSFDVEEAAAFEEILRMDRAALAERVIPAAEVMLRIRHEES